jgi:DNA-binding transcriptional LysR family regulator
MNINLNQLRAFYAVAKNGTFSKAAEELFVTEPAVFVQVRGLERCLGLKLIDKFGKDLRLTEVGRLLYDHAVKIFNLVDETERAIKEVGALNKGELRVGTTSILAEYLLPIILPAFSANHTKIQVYLEETNSSQLVKGVLAHDYEMAIVARVAYPDAIESTPLTRDEIILIASPEDSLASKKRCSLKELNGYPMICRDVRSATRQAVWKEFEKRDIKPSAVIEAGNTELIKRLVASGRGVSLLSEVCVRGEIERGELAAIPVVEGPFFLDIDAIHLKGKTLSPVAAAFLNFLVQRGTSENLNHFVDAMRGRRPLVALS